MPWLALYLVELALFLSPLWIFRQQLVWYLMLLIGLTSFWLGLRLQVPLQSMLFVLTVFRVLNLLRVKKARMHTRYLWRMTSRTAVYILGFHVLAFWLFLLSQLIAPERLLQALIVMQLFGAFGLLLVTVKNVVKLKFTMPQLYLSDAELPTVTVAIPARNETIDLHECLDTILASDYPKLEIIVLDDCSQAKTADIIRGYAHDGVRFVRGEPPANRWLAKNQAYHKLYQEANGDLVLFCGVDVRLGKQAIRSMVNLLHARKKSMLSVLPIRDRSTISAAFIQPIRYWWELALPRRLFNRPPVLSTCWLIDRKVLKKLGGFAAVCHAILPEGFFARELVASDGYSFIRSSGELDVRTVKSLASQRDTTLRVRYPQLRRRLELVLLLSSIEVIFLFIPFVFAVGSVWWTLAGLHIVPLITCACIILTHLTVLQVTNPANVPLGVINFPLVMLVELVLGYASMLKYEFFSVNWKDRNICEPVMHVVPSLPKITD